MKTTKPVTKKAKEPVPPSKIDTSWFKDRIATKKLSQRKLAKSIGVDPAAMSLMLRGMRGWDPHEIEAIAIELGVPVGEVLEHVGVDSHAGERGQVPVIGRADITGVVRMARPADGPRRVPAPEGMPDDAAAIRYEGDGFTDGWLGYFKPSNGVDNTATGQLCVVQVAGKTDQWHIRVVKRGYARGAFTLADPFGQSAAIEGVKLASAAPVLWLRLAA